MLIKIAFTSCSDHWNKLRIGLFFNINIILSSNFCSTSLYFHVLRILSHPRKKQQHICPFILLWSSRFLFPRYCIISNKSSFPPALSDCIFQVVNIGLVSFYSQCVLFGPVHLIFKIPMYSC